MAFYVFDYFKGILHCFPPEAVASIMFIMLGYDELLMRNLFTVLSVVSSEGGACVVPQWDSDLSRGFVTVTRASHGVPDRDLLT